MILLCEMILLHFANNQKIFMHALQIPVKQKFAILRDYMKCRLRMLMYVSRLICKFIYVKNQLLSAVLFMSLGEISNDFQVSTTNYLYIYI